MHCCTPNLSLYFQFQGSFQNAPKEESAPKSKSQELQLQRRREYQQALRNRRKEDSKKYEAFKAKDRERKRKAKQDGKTRGKDSMTERELRSHRKKMKLYMRDYRAKKKNIPATGVYKIQIDILFNDF